jgi:hypothetical protein
VDLLSGQGLPEALREAGVVVNLTNSPTFDDASPAFFQTTMDNLLTAAKAAGVSRRRPAGWAVPVLTAARSAG